MVENKLDQLPHFFIMLFKYLQQDVTRISMHRGLPWRIPKVLSLKESEYMASQKKKAYLSLNGFLVPRTPSCRQDFASTFPFAWKLSPRLFDWQCLHLRPQLHRAKIKCHLFKVSSLTTL